MRTPKLNSLNDALASMMSRVEQSADKLHKRMDSAGTLAEEGINKLAGVVGHVEATARTIHDTVNQISNGGPPLDDAPASSQEPRA